MPKVRVAEPFDTYFRGIPVSAVAGEEFDGDVAVAFLAASLPVDVIESDPEAAPAEPEPVVEADSPVFDSVAADVPVAPDPS